MDHRGRWLQIVSIGYFPDENGNWRGHWIGRAFKRSTGPGGRRWRDVRGLSFASRRRRRIWAFWIGPDRTPAPARRPVPDHVRKALETLVSQRDGEHPGRYDMVDQSQIDVLIDYVWRLL